MQRLPHVQRHETVGLRSRSSTRWRSSSRSGKPRSRRRVERCAVASAGVPRPEHPGDPRHQDGRDDGDDGEGHVSGPPLRASRVGRVWAIVSRTISALVGAVATVFPCAGRPRHPPPQSCSTSKPVSCDIESSPHFMYLSEIARHAETDPTIPRCDGPSSGRDPLGDLSRGRTMPRRA
jgi:hypothetical protein